MKTLIKKSPEYTKEPEFPVLMQSIDDIGLVVLFTNRSDGTVLCVDDPDKKIYKIGMVRTDWIFGSFIKLKGQLVLTNDEEIPE